LEAQRLRSGRVQHEQTDRLRRLGHGGRFAQHGRLVVPEQSVERERHILADGDLDPRGIATLHLHRHDGRAGAFHEHRSRQAVAGRLDVFVALRLVLSDDDGAQRRGVRHALKVVAGGVHAAGVHRERRPHPDRGDAARPDQRDVPRLLAVEAAHESPPNLAE
jgi:hypothetical protein